MRKNQEINQAVAILRKKGDKISVIQADVLAGRRTEVWVFEHFVRDVSEENRDEAAYCAAREAALFLAGKLELDELIPEYEQETNVEISHICDTITISMAEFTSLVKRIERLERRAGLQKAIPTTKRKSADEVTADDLISQIDACKYIGCGKTTIKRWADNGFITGYLKGLNVYYSKRELDRSAVVKEHRTKQKEGL